jgi:predicted acyltransferase
MRGGKKWMLIFTVVGMNSIFIYMFCNTAGHMWLNDFLMIFTGGIFGSLHAPESMINIINALLVYVTEWYLCYWLYQRKIFFKI